MFLSGERVITYNLDEGTIHGLLTMANKVTPPCNEDNIQEVPSPNQLEVPFCPADAVAILFTSPSGFL